MERGNDRNATFYNELRGMAARLNQMAEHLDQESDLLVIGGDAEEGEFSVDLLDGLAPQLVADILKSVARQSGGGGNADSFWPDMASEVVRNVAVVSQPFDLTVKGLEWKKEHGERPYSLAFIYQLAMSPDTLLEVVLKGIKDTVETDFEVISEYVTPELFDAIKFLSDTWLPMTPATQDGIKVNISKILGPFAGDVVLRRRFASGNGASLADNPQLLAKLARTHFSVLEFGVAARLMNVFLTTLLMSAAIHRVKASKANPRASN